MATATTIPQTGSLRVGDPAPQFELIMATKDSIAGAPFSLKEANSKGPLLLAFYPADWSSGCTREMCSFRDNFAEIATLGVDVYGISGDYPHSHREWARHLNLPFPLLSDHRRDVSRLYQSFNESTGYTRRTVFLIASNGLITYIDLNFGSSNEESYSRLYEAIRQLPK
ncbi:MAG: redoxin domain-containing protein [Ignavibacteria bacterium]|nr:redoxin domain-containing protein [Ignavibacteria bacterium]